MKRILIAIDYSPAAEKVAASGYALAKSLKAELAIVHVITEAAFYAMDYSPIMGYKGGYTAGTIEVLDDITKEAEELLKSLIKGIKDTQEYAKENGGRINPIPYGSTNNEPYVFIGKEEHIRPLTKISFDVAVTTSNTDVTPITTGPLSIDANGN